MARKEARLVDEQLICECEMVSRSSFEDAVRRRATTNLDDIRRSLTTRRRARRQACAEDRKPGRVEHQPRAQPNGHRPTARGRQGEQAGRKVQAEEVGELIRAR